MNRWEKLNCWSAATGAAALLVFGGYALPRPAEEPPAPAPAVEHVAGPAEELVDSPLPGGMTEEELRDDAWLSYEALDLRADAEAMGLLPEHEATYQYRVPALSAGQFSVTSQTDPSIVHVFHYVEFTRA